MFYSSFVCHLVFRLGSLCEDATSINDENNFFPDKRGRRDLWNGDSKKSQTEDDERHFFFRDNQDRTDVEKCVTERISEDENSWNDKWERNYSPEINQRVNKGRNKLKDQRNETYQASKRELRRQQLKQQQQQRRRRVTEREDTYQGGVKKRATKQGGDGGGSYLNAASQATTKCDVAYRSGASQSGLSPKETAYLHEWRKEDIGLAMVFS